MGMGRGVISCLDLFLSLSLSFLYFLNFQFHWMPFKCFLYTERGVGVEGSGIPAIDFTDCY